MGYRKGIPVLSGTTGWLAHKHELDQLAIRKRTAFSTLSNYSIE